MIPQAFIPETLPAEQPSKTWRLGGSGFISGLEAVKQAVYLILATERYRYIIYSWDYGAETDCLFGQPVSFVRPELERRIREALTQDSRITGVDGFSFECGKKTLSCTFTVHTLYGDFSSAYGEGTGGSYV